MITAFTNRCPANRVQCTPLLVWMAGGNFGVKHEHWPNGVRCDHVTLTSLANRDLIMLDERRSTSLRFLPTPLGETLADAARRGAAADETPEPFSTAAAEAINHGLRDPDRRSGLILEAVVDAYAADPTEPVVLYDFDQGSIVMSDAWSLPPAVRRHDFMLLDDADLVRIVSVEGTANIEVVPTARGRAVVDSSLQAIDELIEEAEDHGEKTRLQRARAQVVTTGVSAAPGIVSGLIVKAITG